MTIWGEKVYVPALMGASGITKEQAKTCLYYAVATYLIPDKLKLIPLLVIYGPQGTGKTSLLSQLRRMVNSPKKVNVKTSATLRDSLGVALTALIDEGDKVDEDLLIQRYDKKTSIVTHNVALVPSYYRAKKTNIFGATIIVRRTPFQDAALTSRSIFIRTTINVGIYELKTLASAHEKIAELAEDIEITQSSSDRTRDNWTPLQIIAEYVGDDEWIEYSKSEIETSQKSFMGSQNYEPESALLMVLRENMIQMESKGKAVVGADVLVKDIRNELKDEFDIHWKNVQIQDACQALGFEIRSHSGYPRVKESVKLLQKLLKSRGI